MSDVHNVLGCEIVPVGQPADSLPEKAAASILGDLPPQLGRAPAHDAVQAMERRFQSSQLLEDALRDACGSGGAARERHMDAFAA